MDEVGEEVLGEKESDGLSVTGRIVRLWVFPSTAPLPLKACVYNACSRYVAAAMNNLMPKEPAAGRGGARGRRGGGRGAGRAAKAPPKQQPAGRGRGFTNSAFRRSGPWCSHYVPFSIQPIRTFNPIKKRIHAGLYLDLQVASAPFHCYSPLLMPSPSLPPLLAPLPNRCFLSGLALWSYAPHPNKPSAPRLPSPSVSISPNHPLRLIVLLFTKASLYHKLFSPTPRLFYPISRPRSA